MLEHLQQNTIIWVVLSICTIIGVPSFVYTIFSRHKDKTKKEISTISKSNTIVKKGKRAIEKLDISFDGKSVDNLVITKIAIWNSGNVVLNHDDFASEGKLCIISKDETEILYAEIISESDSMNQFEINQIDNHKIIIDFEYIEKRNGIVIQLIHTGESSDLDLCCKIKGGNQINKLPKRGLIEKMASKYALNVSNDSIRIFVSVFITINSGILFICVVFAVLNMFNIIPSSAFNERIDFPIWVSCLISVVLIIFVVITLVSSIKSIKYVFKTDIPAEFRGII